MNQTPTAAHTQPVVAPPPGDFYHDSDLLGAEITELCGYIYAATYRLLVLIREFDQKGLWQLSYHYNDDGSLVIKGRFPPEQGALILKALEMAMERQFKEAHGGDKADTVPTGETSLDNLLQLCRRSHGLGFGRDALVTCSEKGSATIN